MKASTQLKSALLALWLLSGFAVPAWANSVPLDQTGLISPPGAFPLDIPFIITSAGTYDVTLADLGAQTNAHLPVAIFPNFDLLSVVLHSSTQVYAALAIPPGNNPSSTMFQIAPGSYLASIFAVVHQPAPFPSIPDLGRGVYGIKIAAVPLPVSVILFGSAMVGLLMVGRRGKSNDLSQ